MRGAIGRLVEMQLRTIYGIDGRVDFGNGRRTVFMIGHLEKMAVRQHLEIDG